ncbi:MarR family transcriptional regulator [Sphingobacterium rhinopitheci]|nr:MarR family transcriptional regulator [Sphingobacterium rhinopitheci]
MSFNNQVKISHFKNEWHKTTINILLTNNWLIKELELRANRKDITLQQFNVLRILRGQFPNPISNTLVKKRMINSTPDISRLVERLVLKNLVVRAQNVADKRIVDLMITELGMKLLASLEEDMILGDILFQNITETEALQLSQLLDKLRGE